MSMVLNKTIYISLILWFLNTTSKQVLMDKVHSLPLHDYSNSISIIILSNSSMQTNNTQLLDLVRNSAPELGQAKTFGWLSQRPLVENWYSLSFTSSLYGSNSRHRSLSVEEGSWGSQGANVHDKLIDSYLTHEGHFFGCEVFFSRDNFCCEVTQSLVCSWKLVFGNR